MCGSRKYPYSPHRRDWKFRGGGGSQKTQKFKAMYEAKMEFPEGWGVIGKIPSVGGVWIFPGTTLIVKKTLRRFQLLNKKITLGQNQTLHFSVIHAVLVLLES